MGEVAHWDKLLTQALLERGLLTRTALEEAFRELDDATRAGEQVSLSQVLLRRRNVEAARLQEVFQEILQREVTCPSCGQSVRAVERSRCPGCDRPLELCPDVERTQQIAGGGSTPAAPHERVILGRYRVRALLGEGGMATVSLADDIQFRRTVALKELKHSDPRLIQRFLREAEILGKLQHPGIVQVHDVVEDQGRWIIVMQYIRGKTLDRRLTEKSMPQREAVGVVAQVARIIQHAHDHGVIHRDLKPSNVMLDDAGRVFLMDFGLAKEVTHDSLALTKPGALMGTPRYMSPEQVAGGRVDELSDVYALGVMLYEILSGGASPFYGDSEMELYGRIVTDEPRPPRQYDPAVAPDLEVVCMKAMAKDWWERYPDAGALALDLELFLRGEPVRAQKASVVRRLARRAIKYRVAVGVWALVVATLVSGALLWSHRRDQDREFARLLGEADAAASLETAARFLSQAAALRRDDAELAPRQARVETMKSALLGEADRALAGRRHREAIEAYGRVRGIDGDNARARDGLERARRDFDRAQELGRAAWERLARAAEKIEEYDRRLLLPHEDYKPEAAAALLAAARRLVDENLALEEIVDRAVAARSRQRLSQIEAREGRHRAALAALERAIVLDPAPELVFQRGLVRLGLYRAEVAALRGSELAPHVKEGIPLLEPVRKAALEDIQKGVASGVASGRELEYARAALEYAQNDFTQALDRLTALETEPESRIWKLKGDVLMALNEREKAIDAYAKGAIVTRSDYEAHFGLGNAWYLMARHHRRDPVRFEELTRKAHDAYSIAIRLKPTVAEIHSARGQLAVFMVERGTLNREITGDEVIAAAADLEKAIALEDADVDARRALATLYVQTALGWILERRIKDPPETERRLDRAIAVLDEAVARAPELVKLRRDRGAAHVIKGLFVQTQKKDPLPQFAKGVAELEETTASAPMDDDTVQFMAFAYLFSAVYKLGKFQDPKPDFEGAIAATTRTIERTTGEPRGRASAARGLCRILYGFYFHFFGKRAEAAAQLEACVEDLRVARNALAEFSVVREEPVAEFVKAIQKQVAEEDPAAAFTEAARLFTESLSREWPNGRVAFVVRTFFKLMRGFCYFYTERWKEADADWRELVEKFPPAAPMLEPKLKEIEKKLKGEVPP